MKRILIGLLLACGWGAVPLHAKIPGLEDIWQIHMAMGPNHDHNVDEKRIANPEPTDQCKGFSFHASVAQDGKFTITNARNNYGKTYATR